jgi:ABC-2 type transport system permease protein
MDSKNIDYVELSKSIKLISEDSPSLTLISNIENQLEKILTDLNFEKVGLDLTLIKNSNIYINLFQESFEGEETTKVDGLIKVLFGLVLGGLLYMFIFIYGSMIMRSVIEEKSNRIVEIIISSVKPTQLMMGKIIGTSLAGLTQVLIWNFLGFIILNIVGSSMGVSTENMSNLDSLQAADVEPFAIEILSAVFNLPIFNILISFVLYFLFGYLLYASIFAAIGAAVDNETDSQQFMLPISIPLIVALYVGMLTVPEDPGGTISTFFSHFPLTSPVVMMMRIPYGVPIYEQIISLSILVVTFFATVWFAAKIYRVGILMYGQKPSYKDLYKWLKY